VPSSGPSPKLSRLKRSLKSAGISVLHGGLLFVAPHFVCRVYRQLLNNI
jgi:hypothetical protein